MQISISKLNYENPLGLSCAAPKQLVVTELLQMLLELFYFLRVLIQNERFTQDEWRRALFQMLLEFKQYQSELKEYVLSQIKSSQDIGIHISSSRQGNILEALNLAITRMFVRSVD